MLKKLVIPIIIYIFLMFFIPCAAVYFFCNTPKLAKNPIYVKTYIADRNTVSEFELEEYLVGVVGAEMPATFPDEALKAQAVAARTFIISKMNSASKDADTHDGSGAPVCTDPSHCKAWKSQEELASAWGEEGGKAEEYLTKIKNAVQSTKGEIITYDGKPIAAVYYSMSGGKTENSVDVWGGDVPYLKSVSSSFDQKAPGFNSESAFTTDEFKRVISAENPNVVFADNPELWVSDVVYSEGGGVISLKIGGKEFKGTRLRTLFSLRSHNFTLSFADGLAIFKVKGYGHGVGMSQWGCKYLAEDGKTYVDILKYYYSGVEIENGG